MLSVKADSIKILVVDDSAFMRKAITMMLESDPAIKVIASARDGEEGVEKALKLKPDLITMDIEMPRMDGLAALKKIMATHPMPVMMLSSLTTDGADATLDALELGAVDFIPKQLSFVSLDIVKIQDELLAKIKNIVARKHTIMSSIKRRLKAAQAAGKKHTATRSAGIIKSPISNLARGITKRNHPISIIAIGSSTGGPLALQSVIPKLPRNLPVGVVIAQHMPAKFTKSLADRLDSLSQVTVVEARGGEEIEAGVVYIAPGQKHLMVKKSGTKSIVIVQTYPESAMYKPCVDILMSSVSDIYGKTAMGVILTGMGHDGVDGLKKIKSKNGIIIAQNEDSCVVYGMPKAVVEAGIANHIVSIDDIGNEIISYF